MTAEPEVKYIVRHVVGTVAKWDSQYRWNSYFWDRRDNLRSYGTWQFNSTVCLSCLYLSLV